MRTFITLSFALVLNIGLYLIMIYIKGDTQQMLDDRENLLAARHQLQEDIRVLQAERAHTANLGRLEVLAASLNMQPLQTNQLHQWQTWEGNLTP